MPLYLAGDTTNAVLHLVQGERVRVTGVGRHWVQVVHKYKDYFMRRQFITLRDDLKVRFVVNSEVRSTSDFTLSESWTGYANYKQTTASKVGTWQIQVLRGDVLLSEQTVQVQ